jgi:hypothetical protein
VPFDINKAPDWAIDIYLNLPATLSKRAAAKVLGISQRTLQRRLDARDIVFCKLGSHDNSPVVIPKLAVISYLVETSSETNAASISE